MITSKTLNKFATLLSAIYRNGNKKKGKSYNKDLSPEVASQVTAIEHCLYGLLDRLAYAHLDRTGKPIHLDARTAKAFQDVIKSIHENEGEYGNSDEHWFNILTQYPEGTLDGVLKVEHDVAERMAESENPDAKLKEAAPIDADARLREAFMGDDGTVWAATTPQADLELLHTPHNLNAAE